MVSPTEMDYARHARLTLDRLWPRVATRYDRFAAGTATHWQAFLARLERHFGRLFELTVGLYGGQYDYLYHLEALLDGMAQAWIARPDELKALDSERDAHPDWFQSHQMLGGVCYVDLFAGNLQGIRDRIPYFRELGLTYLHLMPLFRSPAGDNDGGYAISSYREVNAALGTIEELAQLAGDLRHSGISLVLDFVFNHTSHEHEWAWRARAGDIEYQEYYHVFPNRQMPDAYERHLREIFPDEHPGAFTFWPEIDRWVWTTFHAYQWDLNYHNPAVFVRMALEMLYLANRGVEVLRLDAVAFIWKQLGTACENLPQAHRIIQAFNAVARIAAPALLFKSEAIVHPDEVARYISADECQLSYNPLLMALLWESLATRQVRLLELALRERFALPEGCAWVNYVRCHDDIGWTFSDEDALRLGIRGHDHRQFLNLFYTGRFEGSFACGLPFQENPRTGDCRISGTCASLAGLEKAHREETEHEVELAVRRILLIHSVILTIGGIPLLYLGDEVGQLNDYGFLQDPAKASDSRWVHRPRVTWELLARRRTPGTLEAQVFERLQRLIALRRNHVVFGGQRMQVVQTGNPHVLGYVRSHAGQRALLLANFSEQPQTLMANLLRLHLMGYDFIELVTNQPLPYQDLQLEPYQFCCIQVAAS
jgi:amylosucrase